MGITVKASEVIDCDGVRYDTTSSFSDSRYVTICCNLDICYLLSTPLFWQKKRENAREKGKRTGKKNSETIAEFFDMVFFGLRKVSLAFHITVFFSDFLTEDVLIGRELDVLSVLFLESSSD